MGITEEGIKGEQQLFQFLRENNFKFFQPDAIGLKNNKYYIFECKHQELFNPPPFSGHGLPKWQVDARIKFQTITGIKSVLVIFNKPFAKTKTIYYQLLEKLEKGEFIDTKGLKPRRIYKIDSFKKKILTNNQTCHGAVTT